MSPNNALRITKKIITSLTKTTATPEDIRNDSILLGNNINISFEGTSGNNEIDVSGGQFLIVTGDSSGVDISGVNPQNLSGVKEILKFDGNLIISSKLSCNKNINVSGDIKFPNTIITENHIYNKDGKSLNFNNIGSNGTLSCTQFIGNHTGNVSGDVSGNIIGSVVGDLSGIVGLSSQHPITGTVINANIKFIGNLIGNVSGNVVGNLSGDVGNENSRNIVSGSTITATDTFIGNLSGTATSVKDGIYSTSSVTELSDIDLSGSGEIITVAERTKLEGISDNANLYILPNASGNILGGVKIPDSSGNITIDNSGIISTPSYTPGTNINLTGTTFSVNTNDLSDNVLMRSNSQDISGVKTFNETIFGDISGNATSATFAISTSSLVTDLSGITHGGSGKIITDTERDVINDLSGIDTTANYTELLIASANVSGGIIVGDTMSINDGVLNNITYYQGNGLNLTGTTFSVNTTDLSDNVLMRSNNQDISGVKTFNETIIGNVSGNATSATLAITNSSLVTDLKGMTHGGSGRIITDTERAIINDLSGIDTTANYTELPIASTTLSGGIIVGTGLTIGATGVLSVSASHTRYNSGYGINLSGTTLSVNTDDLSDNVFIRSGNQSVSGVKTFGENIIGNISGNATSATLAITSSSEVTDLSGMTHTGSGKIITNDERDVINDLSGIDISANYTELPIATTTLSGGIIIGSGLTIDTSGVLNVLGDSTSYDSGYGINLSGTTFSVNTSDLSNNILMRSDDQNISGVKSFGEIIIGNISGNATSATLAITSSSEVTDLSGMTHTGSGRIITNAERLVINDLSGIDLSANYTELPIASKTLSGGIIVGSGLTIDASGVLNISGTSISYTSGYGLNLSGTTFSVNTIDLSDNILMRSGNQNISGVKTFGENIIGNISGNATTATFAITSSSVVTDLSGMTHTGSSRIITDAERSVINDLSGIDLSANYTELPIASTTISGGIIVGSGLTIDASGVLNVSGGSSSYDSGFGLNLSGTTFSVNTGDLSNNILMRSSNQNISGVKSFGENIIGNISGNATTATHAITTSSEVTDLSGMTHGGSGKIITDVERTVINDLSGGVSTYDLPTASGDVLGGISTQVNNISLGGIHNEYTFNGVEYVTHTFTSNSNFVLSENITCDYLVVGGGGGGSQNRYGTNQRGAGGGGAGGVVYKSDQTLNAGTYILIVGDGGDGAIDDNQVNGRRGSYSSFNSIEAGGGGGGHGHSTSSTYSTGDSSQSWSRGVLEWDASGNGASSGGKRDTSTTSLPDLFTSNGLEKGGYGARGGSWPFTGGGGGGCGSNSLGSNGSSTSGGSGRSIDITGASYTYGEGGDGDVNGDQPQATYGSGGNGSRDTNDGGKGGDGIIIIRYHKSQHQILKVTGDVIDLLGDINPPVATNSTLGGAKLSTNIDISNNEFIDTIVPKFYADFSGNTNTSSPYIFSTNSTALTHTGHTLTFYKPPNTLISAKWSGVYNVTGSDRDEYMLNFRIKINKDSGGVLDNSGVSMAAGYQAWGLEGTSSNSTRSGALNGSSITLPNQLTDTSDNILASGNTDISVWLRGYGGSGDSTGGTITDYTTGGVKYILHTFTSSSNFTIVSNINCDFLIVGGGGGGGWNNFANWSGRRGAAGGGAGGVVTGTLSNLTPGSYYVTVGVGGDAGIDNNQVNGRRGSYSSFNSLEAGGGGGGHGHSNSSTSSTGDATIMHSKGVLEWNAAGNGASSGGQSQGRGGGTGTADSSTSNGPEKGGTGAQGGSWPFTGGGGGGCGSNSLGSNGSGTSGGSGRSIDITGSSYTYGEGGDPDLNSNQPQANYGSGGNGNKYGNDAGKGGDGIVVIRYTESQISSLPPETLNLSSSMLSAWVYPA